MEAQLEVVFSMWSTPGLYHAIDTSKQFGLSLVASKQATRKGAPVQRDKKDNRTTECDCKGVGQ
jgi:hypothetical protein